jgi:LAS superfamily LD-carboxypeptidase LdcB
VLFRSQRTGRKPVVKRKFLGKTWFLKKGKSPSATPGTSNHGWALAIDVGLATKTGTIASLAGNAKAFAWMCQNAPRYGFYLAGPSKKLGKPNPEFEAWHWQYCLGDKIPPALRG